MVYNEIIGLGIISRANKQERAVNILEIKSKKIILANIVIMAVLGLLTVWSYKSENMFNAALPVISSFSLLVFDITTKNISNQNKLSIIINTLLYSIAFLAVYYMILLIFHIDLGIIVRLLFIHIFLDIYSIARYFSKNISIINKVIFYVLFFTSFTLLAIYGIYKNLDLIDAIMLSLSTASLISALFIVSISFSNSKKKLLENGGMNNNG